MSLCPAWADVDVHHASGFCCVQLSHNRKALLRYLLRIIALSSYSPTGNLAATRPQDDDAQLLFASLKVRMLCEMSSICDGVLCQ